MRKRNSKSIDKKRKEPKVNVNMPHERLGLFLITLGFLVLFSTYFFYDSWELKKGQFYFCMIILGLGVFYCGLFLSVRHPYIMAIDYLRRCKKHFTMIIFLFFFMMAVGYIFFDKLRFLDELLKGIFSKATGLNVFEMIDFIFFNNLFVSFISLFLGVILGLFPIIMACENGLVLGYVFRLTAIKVGAGEFWRILPHGIFELPAIFISFAMGLKLGMFIFNKNPLKVLKERIRYSIIVFLFIIVPLLILAGTIEGIFIAISG